MILREYIGTALFNERTIQGRTLRNVAERARISLGYLSEVERGQKEISSELLISICDALYMTVGDLMVDVTVAMKKHEDIETVAKAKMQEQLKLDATIYTTTNTKRIQRGLDTVNNKG